MSINFNIKIFLMTNHKKKHNIYLILNNINLIILIFSSFYLSIFIFFYVIFSYLSYFMFFMFFSSFSEEHKEELHNSNSFICGGIPASPQDSSQPSFDFIDSSV